MILLRLQLMIDMSVPLDFEVLRPDPANLYVCNGSPVSSPIDLSETAHTSKVCV